MVLKLNLPDALNPMTQEMSLEFRQAIEQIGGDPGIKGVILTGSGQAFSAGGNLKEMQHRTEIPPFRHKEEVRQFYRSFLSIRNLDGLVKSKKSRHSCESSPPQADRTT
jgi:enoyl-CoA hydratase